MRACLRHVTMSLRGFLCQLICCHIFPSSLSAAAITRLIDYHARLDAAVMLFALRARCLRVDMPRRAAATACRFSRAISLLQGDSALSLIFFLFMLRACCCRCCHAAMRLLMLPAYAADAASALRASCLFFSYAYCLFMLLYAMLMLPLAFQLEVTQQRVIRRCCRHACAALISILLRQRYFADFTLPPCHIDEMPPDDAAAAPLFRHVCRHFRCLRHMLPLSRRCY